MENEQTNLQAQGGSNRLSTVIEKIERMYAGNGSSDEEDVLDKEPAYDEYDTEDTFIDDAELDDYFRVDTSSSKYDGFFIHRGKLEVTESTISTNQQPTKRRHKDLTKVHGGNDDDLNPNKTLKKGNGGKKASSLVARNSTSESYRVAMHVHGEDTERQDTSNVQQRPGVLSSEKHANKSKEGELQDTSSYRSNDDSSHRNLKLMSNAGSSAKQEKDVQIQKRKEEIAVMVRQRIPHMKSKVEQLVAQSDDFQEAGPKEKKALKRKYIMDDLLEDKICDLYDVYVEGLKEDPSAPVRRLYKELAVLFPSGIMDVDGIKSAVRRAKQRKQCSVRKDQNRIKKKKASGSKAKDTASNQLHTREKLHSDSRCHTSKPVFNSARAHFAVANCSDIDQRKKVKAKGSSSSSPDDDVTLNVLLERIIKRKANPEAVEARSLPEKLVAERPRKRQRQHKNVAVPLPTSNHQVVPFEL